MRAAEQAAAEQTRVAAFLAVIRAAASKAALGVNYVPSTPNLARVVEPAALSAALQAAFPELLEAGAGAAAVADLLPWPPRARGSARGAVASPGECAAEEKPAVGQSAWGECPAAPTDRGDMWAVVRQVQAHGVPASRPATARCTSAASQRHRPPSATISGGRGRAGAKLRGAAHGVRWDSAAERRTAWVLPPPTTAAPKAGLKRPVSASAIGFSKGMARTAYPEVDIESF